MTDELVADIPQDAPTEASPTSEGASTGAWPKEVQAEFTKKSQALAEKRRSFDSQRQQWQQQQQYQRQQQQMQQRQQQYQAQQRQGQQTQAQNKQLLEQLRGMSYLDGSTAATVFERLINEGITPLHQALAQRDQALAQMYKEHKALREGLGQHTTKTAEADLTQRFSKMRDEHGLPDEEWANQYLQDVWYSHEGAGLANEYPEMVRARLEAVRNGIRNMDRATAQKAKASPFPGKGGEVAITDGKTGGYKTPQDRADELWPMLNPGQTE